MAHPIPEADVLVHAGDLTWRGTKDEIVSELTYLDSLPHPHKILIAGNHDFYFDERFKDGYLFREWVIRRDETVEEMLKRFPSIIYLQDSSVRLNGTNFYGSPWQPHFYNWAFNFAATTDSRGRVWQHNRGQAQATWKKIPEDTHVLITHGPPEGIMDLATDGDDPRCGCPELRRAIADREQLQAHIFGHIHEQAGYLQEDGVQFVNAAICTRGYKPKNKPIVIEV
jgi:predicted phosphohydrolase